jgi:3'-phosphoadenosine 5'-phosphosulfate (PAPS) 3'-phosphatase
MYDPRQDTVDITYKYQAMSYTQNWDRAGRSKFVKAAAGYNTDFDSKNLNIRREYKSMKVYGSFT